MEHVWLGLLVGLACLALGLLVGRLLWRQQRVVDETPAEPAVPVVPDGVSEVLAILRSSAVVVGPHDEVLRTSAQARTLGLVRGSRVAVRQLLELVQQVRSDGQIISADLELSRGRGAPKQFLSVRTAPLGESLVVILAEDRSAARRVEETRRDFVANISHELKTPIGAIALLAEAVEQAADDPEAVAKFAGRMQQESARLGELVSQVIELSRLQADDPLISADELNLDEIIASAVDSCQVDAERQSVSLTIAGRSGIRVMGDPIQLTTAIRNLVQNGVSYSDSGARVTVGSRTSVDDDDDVVDVTVSDNGIGIAQGELQRIFERFYRVDYARSRAQGGTGLGLSIVKHIAAAHGGQVTVWSKVGQGSTFTIRLPAINDQPTELTKQPEPVPPAGRADRTPVIASQEIDQEAAR